MRSKLTCELVTLSKKLYLARRCLAYNPRGGVLVNFFHRFLSNSSRRCWSVGDWLSPDPGGDTAQSQHPCNTPDRVGTSAESEKEDTIARPPQPKDHLIAICDVRGETIARSLADEIMNIAPDCRKEAAVYWSAAQASVVEGDLLGGFDARVRRDARGTVQFVDIGAILINGDAAGLAGAVRKNQYVFRALLR
jgi:hypothetical protein